VRVKQQRNEKNINTKFLFGHICIKNDKNEETFFSRLFRLFNAFCVLRVSSLKQNSSAEQANSTFFLQNSSIKVFFFYTE
jgi:hypothetical protein